MARLPKRLHIKEVIMIIDDLEKRFNQLNETVLHMRGDLIVFNNILMQAINELEKHDPMSAYHLIDKLSKQLKREES